MKKLPLKKALLFLFIFNSPFVFSKNSNELIKIRQAANSLQDQEQFSNAARCERLSAILGVDGSKFTRDAEKIAQLEYDASKDDFLLIVDPALRSNRGYINGLIQGYSVGTGQSESTVARQFFQVLCIDDYRGGVKKHNK